MKKVLAVVLAALLLVLIPLEIASARGGFGGLGRSRGLRGFSSRGSRKDGEKLRERTRLEDADALLRDAAETRRAE